MAKKVTNTTAVKNDAAAVAPAADPLGQTPTEAATTDLAKELAPAHPAVQTAPAMPLHIVDIAAGNLPDLSKTQPLPFDLVADYWTPENKGEEKRVYFDCLKVCPVQDQNDPGIIVQLLCAFFFEKDANGIRSIRNGSKRLVGVIEAYQIQRGTALLITYLGKKKNSNNNFQSDQWSVKPLIVNV